MFQSWVSTSSSHWRTVGRTGCGGHGAVGRHAVDVYQWC